MQKTISVNVLGRSYPLRVEEQHEAFTQRVAELVDQRAHSLAAEAAGHPPLTHMALTALSLGEELLALREDLARLRGFEEEADRLAARLERALDNGSSRPAAGAPRKKRAAKGANPSRQAAVRQTTHSGSAEEPPAAAPLAGDPPAADE